MPQKKGSKQIFDLQKKAFVYLQLSLEGDLPMVGAQI